MSEPTEPPEPPEPADTRDPDVLVWVCLRCGARQHGNPRFCRRCRHTIYRPTWERP